MKASCPFLGQLCSTDLIYAVSMLDGDLFDKLESIARKVRRSVDTFGGIQLIVTGDFFQLPPVSKGTLVKFAFEAETWNTVVKHTYNLTKVFRQSDQSGWTVASVSYADRKFQLSLIC